jgi:flagellar hook protein FlgE
MMRALFSSISGLQNYQTGMDVIGNNIANVNTVGFKASSANFEDVLSQTLQSASAGNGTTGGTNPIQIGTGMGVASVSTNFNVGTAENTGVTTNLALQGNGFFVLANGANDVYSRNGAFSFDQSGNLVDPSTGYKVQGWLADSSGNINTAAAPVSIVIPQSQSMPAKASTSVTFNSGSNLEASAAVGTAVPNSSTLYDTQGGQHSITQTFVKTGANTWLMGVSSNTAGDSLGGTKYEQITFNADGSLTPSTGIQGLSAATVPTATVSFGTGTNPFQLNATAGSTASTNVIALDSNGVPHSYNLSFSNQSGGTTWNYSLTDPNNSSASALTGTVTYTAGTSPYYTFSPANVNPASFGGTTGFNLSVATGANADAANNVTAVSPFTNSSVSPLTISGTGYAPLSITLNGSGITQYNNTGTKAATSNLNSTTDGYAPGSLSGEKIDNAGVITGTFTNGQTLKLGQVALASFDNEQGLDTLGNSYFTSSANSGNAQIGAAGTGNRGTMESGALEMSNVDLSTEFSNMIITQNAFTANSKIITTCDQMLQTLSNLKQ